MASIPVLVTVEPDDPDDWAQLRAEVEAAEVLDPEHPAITFDDEAKAFSYPTAIEIE